MHPLAPFTAALLHAQENYAEAFPLHHAVMELAEKIVGNGGLEISGVNFLCGTAEAVQTIEKVVAPILAAVPHRLRRVVAGEPSLKGVIAPTRGRLGVW